jgi:vacuolar-type H+-ATPase subunit C/Vma6
MRRRLLTREEYVDMMGTGSLDRMLAMLADGPYASDIESALVRARGLDRIDRALRSNLATTLRKMASFYEGRPRELVGVLLSRWDLRNLRALLRFFGVGPSGVDAGGLVVPAGRLGESELGELAAQDGVPSLVDLMVAWGVPSPESAFALLRARAEFMEEGDVSRLEQAIDRAFAAEMDRILAPDTDDAVAILRAETDARNLELALRVRAARRDDEPGWSDVTDLYLPGGLQRPELWEQIADTDPPEVAAEMAGAPSSIPGWSRAVAEWATGGSVVGLSDALQRAITSAARALFVTGDQLGFDIPVAFTYAKEAEIRNLSLIARGLVHGIPMTDVEESLEVAA